MMHVSIAPFRSPAPSSRSAAPRTQLLCLLVLLCAPARAAYHSQVPEQAMMLALTASAFGLLALVGVLYRSRWRLARKLWRVAQENAALRRERDGLREREHAARISTQRFRSLTRLSSDWYWEQDAHFRFTMRTSWQLSDEQIAYSDFIGRMPWQLPGIIGDPDWDAHRAVLEKRWPFRGFEYQIRIGKTVRWVSVNGEPMYDENGTFAGYRGTGRDITRNKRAEAALRASKERFNEIVSSMPVGLFIKDAEGRVIMMNHECERQWGVPFSAIKDTDGSHLFAPHEMAEFMAQDRDVLASRSSMEFVCPARSMVNGERLITRNIKKPVFDANGNLSYIIGITMDITEQTRAEELLRRSREALRELARHQAYVKEEERKRIARDIHDDLGQNLMALRLDVTTLVQQDTFEPSRLGRRAAQMMETVDRTIRSVRQIINDLRPAVLDLGLVAALEWQAEEFRKRYGLFCELEIHVDDGALGLDDGRATTLFRVLQESLNNVQRHARATAVHIRLDREGDTLRLTVCDDGKGGVSLQQRGAKTFGLLGMRERLRMFNGALTVDDLPEGGTRLTASLPLPISGRATSANASAPAPP